TFIGDVKGFSSYFVNDNFLLPYEFNWQSKYGVVSFGVKRLDDVTEYVNNQKQHHKEKDLIPDWEQTA
ncbi:MAG: transposase, partial [Ardenticatenaceae bacterium]